MNWECSNLNTIRGKPEKYLRFQENTVLKESLRNVWTVTGNSVTRGNPTRWQTLVAAKRTFASCPSRLNPMSNLDPFTLSNRKPCVMTYKSYQYLTNELREGAERETIFFKIKETQKRRISLLHKCGFRRNRPMTRRTTKYCMTFQMEYNYNKNFT